MSVSVHFFKRLYKYVAPADLFSLPQKKKKKKRNKKKKFNSAKERYHIERCVITMMFIAHKIDISVFISAIHVFECANIYILIYFPLTSHRVFVF